LLETLRSTFSDYDFHSIRLEKLSVRNQIAVFSRCKGVIAPHGSGLSNILFLNKSGFVIELFPRHYVVKCYMNLAKILNLTYRGLILKGDYDKMSQIEADISEIILILQQLLAHKSED